MSYYTCDFPQCRYKAKEVVKWKGEELKACEQHAAGKPRKKDVDHSQKRKGTAQVGGNHYETEIDPIAFGEANLSSVEMNGFYKMNIIKYVARCDRKNGLEDLHKAKDYLDRLIKAYEEQGKIAEGWEDMPLTEEEDAVMKEAELVVMRVMDWKTAIVRRKDVLEEVLRRLVGVELTISHYSDGETHIERVDE